MSSEPDPDWNDRMNALIGTGMLAGLLMQSDHVMVEAVLDGESFTNQLVIRFPDLPSWGMSRRGYLITVSIPPAKEDT